MKTLNELDKIDANLLEPNVEDLKILATKNSITLNSWLFNELSANFLIKFKKGTPDFICEIQKIIEPLIYFHNKKNLSNLKKIPLYKNCLRWFIPWDKIKNEIDAINKSGLIYLPTSYAFKIIYEYIKIKLSPNLFNNLVELREETISASNYVINEINKHIKRNKYARKYLLKMKLINF